MYGMYCAEPVVVLYQCTRPERVCHESAYPLQAGASIFVAGSANKMPADVARALEIVAQREGQMSQQEATSWLKELEKNKRYHVEAWS